MWTVVERRCNFVAFHTVLRPRPKLTPKSPYFGRAFYMSLSLVTWPQSVNVTSIFRAVLRTRDDDDWGGRLHLHQQQSVYSGHGWLLSTRQHPQVHTVWPRRQLLRARLQPKYKVGSVTAELRLGVEHCRREQSYQHVPTFCAPIKHYFVQHGTNIVTIVIVILIELTMISRLW